LNKDVALLEGHIYPDMAVGDMLDDISLLYGYSKRFGAKQSTTYIRVVGNAGTTYLAGTQVFSGSNNIMFDLVSNYTIPSFGYGYAKVRSRTSGSDTNVSALSINKVTPAPSGHQYCINEYMASYGCDSEDDDLYRQRLKDGYNSLSRSTMSQIEQAFMKCNENILKLYYGGLDEQNRIILLVLTETAIDLTTNEFNDILLKSSKFFGLNELRSDNFNGYNIFLKNMTIQPIDVSFRVKLNDGAVIDNIRKDIQIRMSKFMDFRYFKPGSTIQWTSLLDIVRFTNDVVFVPDANFYPMSDIQTDPYKIPIMRGFQMLDLDGNILQDFSGYLNPAYYPNEIDFSFQSSVLRTI
jgi:hypothetical protein